MRKQGGEARGAIWRSDGLIGLALVVLVLVVHLATGFIDSIDKKFFDQVSASTGRKPSDQVVILAIDDQSIANLGRWPWPRDVHAKVIDLLTQAQAKSIAHTAFFFEPQTDRGMVFLEQIREVLSASGAEDPATVRVLSVLKTASDTLDTDAALARSLQASGRVVLPAVFDLGELLGRPDQVLPPPVLRNTLNPDPQVRALTSRKGQWPIPGLANAASAVGHLNQVGDPVDGVVRADPLVVDHAGRWVPSLSLLVAAQSLNLSVPDLRPDGDGLYRLGGIRIPVDESGFFHPQFYPEKEGRPAFVTDSFYDVYAGKIPASKYAGKIVLIGATAAGLGEQLVTPVSTSTSSAVFLAHTTSSLLNAHFFSVPHWSALAGLGAFLIVAAYVAWVLPRVSGRTAAAMASVFVLGLAALEYGLITIAHLWVPMVLPMAALVAGYLGVTTRRFLVTEAGKLKSDEESAETNRMMGLALQGQGQLDMAFDRFRRVPLTDAVMDNLMNLALDFERKRQFNKAQAVYEHMSAHNPEFRDLSVKLKRAKNLSETVMLGGGSSHPGGTLLLDGGGVEKPMLGRYQLEKELGKGAMGIVYLGRDPKIGRVVAIKTMALSQEFEGGELDDARQRFFREAETAGRLQHPHIVTIFDAGEDQELAYIAMEFLKGRDLLEFTRNGQLLPVGLVVSIVARVADALAYAHGLNVVHRDIKPANIMYEPETDTVKVTDFGIARVTDASRTKTGMVLGTPSFMSPEQIAGKKVDGRSDLYSLGVMLFQMLTGVLPFRGDSMAELMFKIANDTAPDVRTLRPEISPALAAVLAKALTKTLDARYQTGREMAEDLRRSMDGTSTAGQPAEVTPSTQSSVGDAYEPTMPYPHASGAFATTVVMESRNGDTVVLAPENGGRGRNE